MTRLISPENNASVMLLTRSQRTFAAAGAVENIDWLKLRRAEKEDCTYPLPVEFAWECSADTSVLELSEAADFTSPMRFIVHGCRACVDDLLAGQEYFWRVNGCSPRRFTTEDAAPRWLHAEGISNVRDMGAWRTADGRRVKQGLIYRGSEMDTHHTITEAGIRTMRDVLGIRTDLDLRGEAVGRVTESPLGKDIEYLLVPAKAYAEFMEQDQKPVCRRLFEILADESRYPIYFHCWGGADRTGTLALMLEAVLGLSDEDMLRDYELTSLSVWGDRSRTSELFVSLLNALDSYGGGSIAEKTVRYLLSCGISEDTLSRIRKNLLI